MSTEKERKTLLDFPAGSGTAELVLEELSRRSRRRRTRRVGLGAATALCVAVGLFVLRSQPAVEPPAAVAELAVHAPRARILSDGSKVEVKEGGVVADHFTPEERRIALESGTAHFAVTHNPNRPFIVTAGDVTVRAVGTAFSVSRTPQGVTVLVTEGKVAVASVSDGKPLGQVAAGSGISIPADRSVVAVSAPEMAAQLQWRVPTLELSSTPVSAVAHALNRLNATQIVISDARLGDARLSGVIRADNVDAFVSVVESEFRATVARDGSTVRLSSGR